MELLTIKDLMKLLHVGKRKVMQILFMEGCPMLPREKKTSPYLVPKDSFIKWYTKRCMK